MPQSLQLTSYIVPEEKGKIRFLLDYQQLIKEIVKSCRPLLSAEESFDLLKGSCCLSAIDMSWGFYHLPLETSNYTAFNAPYGSFDGFVTPMGVTGQPSIFQSLMKKVFLALQGKALFHNKRIAISFFVLLKKSLKDFEGLPKLQRHAVEHQSA